MTTTQMVPLNDLIEPAPVVRAGSTDLPILSMTMHHGLVDQAVKFKKRVASADTSQYKVVHRDQLVVGFPIDEGVLSFQDLYDRAIVSPAYNIWNKRRPGKLHSPYLERFLRSPRALKFYASKLRGTTARRRTLPNSIFLSMPIPLPPLDEQRRIAAVLDHADALRAKRREAIVQLDEFTQSIFLDMFGDARNASAYGQRSFKSLIEEFRYGTSNKSEATGLPTLRIPNVVGGSLNTANLKTVPVADGDAARLKLEPGDLLFVRTNGNPEMVGRCAVYEPSKLTDRRVKGRDVIYASYLIRARLQLDQVHPTYIREFFAGVTGRRALRSRAKTSAGQFNINTAGLGAIPVPVPAFPLQQEFARRVEAVERLKDSHRAHLTELDSLFASLQSRAFRGEQ